MGHIDNQTRPHLCKTSDWTTVGNYCLQHILYFIVLFHERTTPRFMPHPVVNLFCYFATAEIRYVTKCVVIFYLHDAG